MDVRRIVYAVDDDAGVRKALRLLMKSVGLDVETFATGQEFLDRYDRDRLACLVLDVRMAGMSGPDLLEKLGEEGMEIPAVVITGHGDVATTVRVMRAGAVDVLEKPFNDQALLDCVNRAFERAAEIRRRQAEQAAIEARLAWLTPRESEVMTLMVAGKCSKEIARELGISRKTVDLHRMHVMAKLETESVVELVRMVQTLSSGTLSSLSRRAV